MSGEALPAAVAEALVAALGELDEIARNQTASVPTKSGTSYSYSYTDLGAVLGYVRPILKQHGFGLMTPLTCDGNNVTVTPVLLHTSGHVHEFPPFSLPAGRTPQETGSAATYARRYAILAALSLATEDDDGASASQGAAAKAERDQANARFVELGWRDQAEHDEFRALVRQRATETDPDAWASWWRSQEGLKWPLAKADQERVQAELDRLEAERPFEEAK